MTSSSGGDMFHGAHTTFAIHRGLCLTDAALHEEVAEYEEDLEGE